MQRVKKVRVNKEQLQHEAPVHKYRVVKSDDEIAFQSNSDTDGYEDDDEEGSGSDHIPFIKGIGDDGGFPKTRHIFGFMGFLGFAVVYAMRVNLSVAIVAMVNQTAIPRDSLNVVESCPIERPINSTEKSSPEGEFLWDEAKQGLVLGSFFYGYVLTQVPGGRLAELIGGKRVYGYGVLVTAIFTLLTPVAAHLDFSLLLIVRILEGMGEGVTYPAMHAMLAQWIPPMERNTFAAIVYAGSNIGTVISMPLTGWLCSLDFWGGWPSSFYIFGLTGLVWFIFWMYLVYDRPRVHPRISHKEADYIERSIRSIQTRSFAGNLFESPDLELFQKHSEPIPWCAILTSVPVWAIAISMCGQSWAFYTILVDLPTYMSNVQHFDIQSNAILNALPFLSAWFVGIACSILADWMLENGHISVINSYKLWNTVSSVLPSLGLLGMSFAGCDWKWVTFMLVGLGSFGGAICAGNQMNHIALSPQFAGTLFGITNCAANFCGFLAPYVIGLIINHHETLTNWAYVFCLAASVNIGGNFFYLLFASAEEQSWSRRAHRSGLRNVVRT